VSTQRSFCAVDLGASGGRVIVGQLDGGGLALREARRFGNVPVRVLGTLHWDILRLFGDVLDGIRTAAQDGPLASIGVDSWGVDYGLLDETGGLLANPVHYRDARTAAAVPRVLARIPAAELYATTGIQQLPINTIYQLAAESEPALRAASRLLLIPDLLGYWLTGNPGAEVTNASTTQLYDPRARSWATSLMQRAGIPPGLFPPLRQPGEVIGAVRADAGLAAPVRVLAVASHDTASAVAAMPAQGQHVAYICCGTWSLVGMELAEPVLTEASRHANFSNEVGVDGTIRYLRNVMGLWLLQESAKVWAAAGYRPGQGELAAAASREAPLRYVIDADDPSFLVPGDMPARIAGACEKAGQGRPQSPAQTARCILDSLALAHRRAVIAVQALSGRHADVIHLVGGGVRNRLLCQLTADACGTPVVAGPAEASAIGNVLIQARAAGAAPPDLPGLRALVRTTQPLRRYEPRGGQDWQAAERSLAR
jgi:sugar (pentulose or hexulose) kinase